MNTYTTKFWAKCPVNGQSIDYSLTIATREVVMVEALQEHLAGIKEGLHETIADELHTAFGGTQVLRAMHHGVHIETMRPMLAAREAP